MDITIQVVAVQSTHIVSNEGARWKLGQILNVYESSELADLVDLDYLCREPIGSPRTAFIHVKNVPVTVINKVKALLTESQVDGNEALLRRSIFQIDVPSLPNSIKQKVSVDRQATFEWDAVKIYLKNSAANRAIVDEDVI